MFFLVFAGLLMSSPSQADCFLTHPSTPNLTIRRTTQCTPSIKFPAAIPYERAPLVSLLRGGALSVSPETLALCQTLAPQVGICTSTFLYLAPAAAVLQAIRSDDVGSLNTLPLVVMSIVSVSWLAYGLAKRDPYVTLSNIGGCIASIAYVVGILPLLSEQKSALRSAQSVLLAGATAVLGLWTYLGLAKVRVDAMSKMLGIFASALFVVLSASPLSTIRLVLSTRDSSSIMGLLTAAQVINTSLWTTYGLAVKDRFVWGPNIVGLGFGLVQLSLKLMFPAKKLATS